jgi:hypothetical protein
MRIIETHKQSFHSTTETDTAHFNFTRIYKTNDKQKFLITVGSIGWTSEMPDETTDAFSPPLFFAEGLLGGQCINQTDLGGTTNGWFLGGDGYNDTGTSKSHLTTHAPNTILVNDIPLNPFRIVKKHLDGSSHPSIFIVSFNIDIVEE